MSYIKKAKPRKTIPSATKPVHRMLIQSLSQRSVNCAPNVNYRVVIVENVNAFLFPKINGLGECLLLAVHFQVITPNHKISLPVHAKGVND